eukprot:g7919.t1
MPRRTTRSAWFSVKKEADTEDADSRAASDTALVNDEHDLSSGSPQTRSLRSGPRPAPAPPAASAAAAPAFSSSGTSGPVSTSRFFASPSASAAKGRKRKAPESGGTGAAVSGLGRAIAVKEEPQHQGVQQSGARAGRGGFTGGANLSGSESAGTRNRVATACATATPGVVGAQRRSSRVKAVKKEEPLHLPESFLPATGAAAANSGVDMMQARRKKRNGRMGKQKEATKVEAEGQGGGDGVEEKPVPPRLAEKTALIIQVMDKLYPNPPIPINHLDSFTLLCGVLLSAQTTDAQVNLVTKELFRVAPNPLALSKMAHDDLQQIIRSVGLAPTKAKHLIALSKELLDRFDGQVPQTFEGLMSLPGVGRKTAAVVMVQAFNTPAFPVDTHIHRLALRWGLTKNEKNASKVEEDLMAVFPRESWAKLHLQFIYFGREHCQARVHEVSACPICCWVKKTGPNAPKSLSELSCLRDYLASPTPPKKSSKNAIVYSERMLEMEQFKMKLEEATT